MKNAILTVLAIALVPFSAFAVDGVVLINQSTVTAAGGFPYQIKAAGSYKLSGNLIVTGATVGIEIDSDDVTIDLNGFRLSGPIVCVGSPPICSGSSSTGILAGNRQNITVKNGTVRGFNRGIELVGTGGSGGLIADVQASGNSDYGIYGVEVVIIRCSANNNGGIGMTVVNGTVSDSLANRNRYDGFSPYASTLIHNSANGNGRYGIASTTPSPFLIGSNTFINNAVADVVGGTTQNNNLCTSGSC